MKKFIGILLPLCFLLTVFAVPPPVGAKVPGPGDPNVRTAKFWIGEKFYEVNGVRQAMDVAPVIKNGRTLLPLRYVGYAMGLKEQDVSWEPAVGWARLKR
ncbi:MAG: copper amine oxidase N-terminal domain-containing protein, partial [Bacillota bacterium]|nr:copper amine oxidase N-terminal domain-containing protein [Bacillota bacterium]